MHSIWRLAPLLTKGLRPKLLGCILSIQPFPWDAQEGTSASAHRAEVSVYASRFPVSIDEVLIVSITNSYGLLSSVKAFIYRL
jgi:hypothetical protein